MVASCWLFIYDFKITYFINNHKIKTSQLLSQVITSRHSSKLSLILLLTKGGTWGSDCPSESLPPLMKRPALQLRLRTSPFHLCLLRPSFFLCLQASEAKEDTPVTNQPILWRAILTRMILAEQRAWYSSSATVVTAARLCAFCLESYHNSVLPRPYIM